MFLPSSTLWSNQHFSKSFLILGAIMTQVYFLSAQPDFRQKKQGAVDRAISDKLADQISVKDFGAKADGSRTPGCTEWRHLCLEPGID
jgi:hypothetical protein